MVFCIFMSNLGVLALLLGVLLSQLAGQTKWADDASGPPRVGIFIDFDQAPSLSSLAAMEREAGAVLKVTGAQFSWLRFSADSQSETFDDLAVLKFHGACNMGQHENPATMNQV